MEEEFKVSTISWRSTTLFQVGPRPEIVTRFLNKRNNAFVKSRVAANESCKANCRAKAAFQNSINNTLRNPLLSAKEKFSLLFKLMKNNKFTNVPPLVDNNITVQDPTKQSNIFNDFFASKSTVNNLDDIVFQPPSPRNSLFHIWVNPY